MNHKITISAICAVFLCAMAQQATAAEVKSYTVKVVETLPHDPAAYTQGLFFYGGSLYESTGLYGKSSFRKVDLKTGRVLSRLDFNRKYFGEGSCIVDGRLFILTWENKLAFEYDAATLKYVKTYSYPREGWGLTTVPSSFTKFKGARMVASDGSSRLFFLDGKLQTLGSVQVTLHGRPVKYLNELEWIDGRIWANVYLTDMILIIDPSSGAVTATVDCSSLIPKEKRTAGMDVLNGIALRADGAVFLTGKNWPSLFRVKLVEK